jgi:hypothetical protein
MRKFIGALTLKVAQARVRRINFTRVRERGD